jgi:ATP-binding cassette, subfamily B (MDR/TAP), member 1
MRDYGVSLLDVFTAIFVLSFAAVSIGNNSNFIPDINEAKLSASHIFEILDAEDEHQLQEREESKMLKEGIKGHIKLEKVAFKYDSRQQYVFRDMNVEIRPGQKVAFVGPSGCGKSTIMQLLQRFYLPTEGRITIDGVDIKDYDIHYLRSRFGVVSQEPALFNASFRENIRYNKKDATEAEIRAAAEEANALAFIEGKEKLEGLREDGKEKEGAEVELKGEGFDRGVGLKGSHISGGQKQRVAIARAILRDPQILLLDEATSALDAENERHVQDSLDRVMTQKTTLTIAHRIETIRNSDVINVFEKGQIVERGTYSQLLERKGFFYNLERGTQFV